ncbi:MAG: hypothetical protein QNJ16_08205 [Rhodobacter sp.]|nr:hypothetical protein [Rhodobacter sp.]
MPYAAAHRTLGILAPIRGSIAYIRSLAIWLSLVGTDVRPRGPNSARFGPRGLAIALCALFVVEQRDHAFGERVPHLAVNAVWINAVPNWITASPGTWWYA